MNKKTPPWLSQGLHIGLSDLRTVLLSYDLPIALTGTTALVLFVIGATIVVLAVCL